MNNFFNLLKEHKWAIALAVLIGVIMAFPHIYFVIVHQDIYQGVFMGGLDEGLYLARIQEARDGHYWLANPFWVEGKDNPYLWPPLPENFASLFGKFFGLGLINTVLFENFAFPFILFLLLYFLIFSLSRKRGVALISAIVIMTTSNLTGPQALYDLIINQKVPDTFLSYSRLISPQIHSLFFFAFFLIFWFFLERKKWIYGISSGIVLGLLFYIYPFAWMFTASFFVFLILIYLFRKNWPGIKNIFLISLISLLIATPFLYNLLEATQSSYYSEVSLRYGWVKSHSPQIGVTFLILLGIFLLLFPKRPQKRYDFFLAIVLSPLILLNQQIVTGYLLGPARYHHYYYKPFAIIILFIIFFFLFEKFKKGILVKIFIILLLPTSFYNAYLVQITSYKTYEPLGVENQKYGAIFKWLNQNSQKDEVVLANSYISDLIPIYTSLNAIANLDAHYSLTSDEELLNRMFLIYELDGLTAEKAKDVFYQDRENISKRIYAQRYQKEFGRYELIPDSKLNEISSRYMEFLGNNSLKDVLKRYKVKYLVWDVLSEPNWQIDNYSFLTEVYRSNNFKIYALKE